MAMKQHAAERPELADRHEGLTAHRVAESHTGILGRGGS